MKRDEAKKRTDSGGRHHKRVGKRVALAEGALQAEKQRLERASAAGNVALWDWDIITDVLEWSSAIDPMLGFGEDKFPRTIQAWGAILHSDDEARVMETLNRHLRGEAPYEIEYRVRRADGSYIWWHVTGAAERDATGKAVRMTGACTDITERKRAEESMRQAAETRRRLESIINHSPAVVFLWKAEEGWPVEYVSENVRQFGYTPEDFYSGRVPYAQVVHPDDLQRVVAEVAQYSSERGRDEFVQEYRVLSPSGRVIWLDDRTWIRRDERGEITHFQGIILDITERKRAEEALRDSEQKYRLLFERNMAGLYRTRLDGEILECNEVFARILGYESAAEVKARPATGLYLRPDDRRAFIERLQAASVLTDYEERLKRRDGTEAWVLNNVALVRKEGQKPEIQGTMLDITERKRAEEARRTSEAQLSNALKMARAGHWEYEVGSDTFTFNDNFYRIFRTTAEEVGGYTMSSADYARRFCHPEDAAMVGKEVQAAIEATDPHFESELEHRILYADGEVGHIAVRFFIVKDQQGRTVRTHGVNQDITERKKLEAQFIQAQKMESVGRLAGGVAHDFNNMLSVILGHAQLCLDTVDQAQPLHEYLQEILRAARRSADLTRQLLAFARKQPAAPQVIDLNETVEGMLKMLRRLVSEDIDIAWLPGRGIWPVRIDPAQIDQILANLSVNARDAISGVGKVTIETEKAVFDETRCAGHVGLVPGEYVMLALSDDGCGIKKDVLDHLFEPFFTTKAVGHGTGLGLATVYGIVKQNEGFIDVCSEPDKGSTFKIYLPRYAGKVTTPPSDEAVEPPGGGTETVLLVEDETAILQLGKRLLERLGYTVLTAGAPGEAIRIAQEYAAEIHLLVTDVVMPEMSGRVLAEWLSSSRPNLKLLFMSGYTDNVIAHRGVLDEGVHFLQKPFSLRDMAAKVREALDGK